MQMYTNVFEFPDYCSQIKGFHKLEKVLDVLSDLKQEVLLCYSNASGMRVVKNKRKSTSSAPSSLADNLRQLHLRLVRFAPQPFLQQKSTVDLQE